MQAELSYGQAHFSDHPLRGKLPGARGPSLELGVFCIKLQPVTAVWILHTRWRQIPTLYLGLAEAGLGSVWGILFPGVAIGWWRVLADALG